MKPRKVKLVYVGDYYLTLSIVFVVGVLVGLAWSVAQR